MIVEDPKEGHYQLFTFMCTFLCTLQMAKNAKASQNKEILTGYGLPTGPRYFLYLQEYVVLCISEETGDLCQMLQKRIRAGKVYRTQKCPALPACEHSGLVWQSAGQHTCSRIFEQPGPPYPTTPLGSPAH